MPAITISIRHKHGAYYDGTAARNSYTPNGMPFGVTWEEWEKLWATEGPPPERARNEIE